MVLPNLVRVSKLLDTQHRMSKIDRNRSINVRDMRMSEKCSGPFLHALCDDMFGVMGWSLAAPDGETSLYSLNFNSQLFLSPTLAAN